MTTLTDRRKALDWIPVSILAWRGLFTSIVFLLYMRRLLQMVTRWKNEENKDV